MALPSKEAEHLQLGLPRSLTVKGVRLLEDTFLAMAFRSSTKASVITSEGVRHAAGMLSAITPESCPSWAGARNGLRSGYPDNWTRMLMPISHKALNLAAQIRDGGAATATID